MTPPILIRSPLSLVIAQGLVEASDVYGGRSRAAIQANAR